MLSLKRPSRHVELILSYERYARVFVCVKVEKDSYLEDVATEFHVQGLELDWACVTWDADFRYGGEWLVAPVLCRQSLESD